MLQQKTKKIPKNYDESENSENETFKTNWKFIMKIFEIDDKTPKFPRKSNKINSSIQNNNTFKKRSILRYCFNVVNFFFFLKKKNS